MLDPAGQASEQEMKGPVLLLPLVWCCGTSDALPPTVRLCTCVERARVLSVHVCSAQRCCVTLANVLRNQKKVQIWTQWSSQDGGTFLWGQKSPSGAGSESPEPVPALISCLGGGWGGCLDHAVHLGPPTMTL